ncbi:MAG: DUF2490 domain-containing protein [Bacteroidetes bacterium]|nr:DUF2490 domain-containing protein [Bacteroidota bacterium]MDA0950591.1 DUF2490 domain-containing protein [Bacteroidota bacterium]
MLRFPLTLLSVVLVISALQGQEAISHNSMFAVGKLAEKWHYRAESHLVRGDLLAQSRQLIMRPNVIFSISEKLRLSGGITYIYNASYEGGPSNTNEELNYWQQLEVDHRLGRFKTNHWLRLEQRHRVNGYFERLRYRFRVDTPLGQFKHTPITLIAFNELFLVTKGLSSQQMDQNWTFVGVQFPVNKQIHFRTGYRYVELNREIKGQHLHAIHSWLIYRFL